MAGNENIQSVTELSLQLKQRLEAEFTSVWVVGEVSNLSRPSSGHFYFTLKDENAQIRAVIWRSTVARLRFDIEEGQKIICCGDIDLYPPRGSYQLIARKVEPIGEGELQLAFRKLHQKLDAEGLFDPRFKQSIPTLPERIGVVTSPTGAAVRDFCQVVKRRWPQAKILVIPCRVQGAESVPEIVSAIEVAQKLRPRLDTLVVTRGGGSIEDLWSFNDERVVRAIHSCSIPTICGVGHEIDVSLADLAADVRALTPSEAGEKVVPDRGEWISALDETELRLNALLRHQAQVAEERLQALRTRRCFQRPHDMVERLYERIDRGEKALQSATSRALERRAAKIQLSAAQLNSVNPLEVLARGYSLTVDAAGKPIDSAKQVNENDEIRTKLHWGSIVSRVVTIE